MEKQKSFWKKYEFLILALITLASIYLFVLFNQKIDSMLGNELIVYLTPQQQSFYMYYGNVSKTEFDISVENAAHCKTTCSYSFTDRSKNELIDGGNFNISKGEHSAKSYNISIKRLGSGQDLYSFDVKCHSIFSFICLTKGAETSRSSLVTVNYDLTSAEKDLKKILKKNVTELLGLLSNVDASYQKLNQKYFELSHKANLNNLSKEKIDINYAYDNTRISIENLRSVWAVENYIKLNQLFNGTFFENLANIGNSIKNLDKDIDSIIGLHNDLLSELSDLGKNLGELGNFANILDNREVSDNFTVNADKFNKVSSSITNNTFVNYSTIISEISNITRLHDSIARESKIPAAAIFFSMKYSFKYGNDLLCSLKQDCKEDTSLNGTMNNIKNFIEKYPDAAFLNKSCNSLMELNQTYSSSKEEAARAIANKSMKFPSDSEFMALAEKFKDNEIRKINNSYYDSFQQLVSENKTSHDIIKIANSTLPQNIAEILPVSLNDSINLSLYSLSEINFSNEALNLTAKCRNLEKQKERIGKFDFEPVSTNITYRIVSKIDTNLSDNPPICCVFNDCKPCCRDESCKNDPKTFPIIFLHGHSVARASSPEFSLDAFNELQYKLQDDGYLNAGNLLYSENASLQSGEWGVSGKPVTVKVTYYYDIYRKEGKYDIVPTKSESIDTYAVRLNDIINVVKERTGKPKINIIAFSMGGLVARRYIQIFGEDSVDKLITIGTPHKGISGVVADLCPVLGDDKECIDMQQDSLFLNKLNNPSKQPSKAKIYNILGKGCLRNGEDGDGIVLLEQASLKGITNATEFFINGKCSNTLGYFHTDLVDIDKYPETYTIVKSILLG